MAVYGRFRERWNPLKIKSKTSKNKTYDQSGAGSKVYLWLDPGNIASGGLDGSYAYTTTQEADEIIFDIEGDDPSVLPNPATQFDAETLEFSKGSGSFVHTALAGASQMSMASLAKHGKGYDTYISFWFKVSQSSYNTSHGHTLGGLYRTVPANFTVSPGTAETLTDLNPAFLFNLSSSNAIEFRVQKTGSTNRLFFSTENDIFVDGEWVHVSVVIKDDNNLDRVVIFVNGMPAEMATMQNSSFVLNDFNDTTDLDVLLGNVTHRGETYGYRDSNSTTTGEGFFGNLADFVIFSQPTTTDAERENMARFVYEAQREGAYHLHSGIHSSTPRLEQLDLDRDSLYPPNFTLENYTMGAYQEPVARVSSRSESKYTEGALTDLSKSHSGNVEVWSEKASQRFVQTNYDEVSPQVWEETTTVMPHLRLDPSDTLLTNGNWYSDSRSEFFSEDLHPTTGFVISSDTAGLDVPRVDDELYREHYSTDTTQKYVETEVPEEYKDCFVIDIPLPNEADLDLGTDLPGTELSRINGTAVRGNAEAEIANMAYYNFKLGRWDKVLSTNNTLSESEPQHNNFIDANDIGFSPMTGIVVPNQEKVAERVLPMYGMPTSDFGFPFDDKFTPQDNQSIDMSRYIDVPVILEGWEIKTKVVPKVGYSDETGTFFTGLGTSGESPFHYGGHGEAAVFFNPRKHLTGFDENIVVDGSDSYHMGTTIPTAYLVDTDSDSVLDTEQEPPKNQPGLVTSGVTAFLLKRPKITSKDELKAAWQDTARTKTINTFTNLTADQEWEVWQATNSTPLQVENREERMNYRMPSGGEDRNQPEWVTGSTDYSNYENNTVVGWLQHLYHNEAGIDGNHVPLRRHWVREDDTENAYKFRKGTSIIDMLSKESTTYVQNLLYSNSSEYDFQATGPSKTIGKADGMPITNFFIKDHTGTGLGVHRSSSDQSVYFAVGTSSDTELSVGDGTLADHAIIPRYGAGEIKGRVTLPRLNLPTNRESSSDSINTLHTRVPIFEDLVDDAVVILAPTDQLVLGMQNSVSTTYASQQIKGGSNSFIRWGRTSLRIPAQDSNKTNSYLRLYVKKTRRDNDFNVIADSSNYNANVNRDLGDQAVADQYITPNRSIYSGSMADDIIGPTFFTPPIMRTEVTWTHSADSLLQQYDWRASEGGGSFWNAARSVGLGIDNGYFEVTEDYGGNQIISGNHTPLNWASCSDRVFKDRGQTSFPRRPAIDWKDPDGYDKQLTRSELSGDTNGIWPANHWQNIFEAHHWIITKQNPLADAEEYAHNSSYRGPNRSRVIPFRPLPMAYIEELCPNDGAPSSGIANVTISDVTPGGFSDTIDQTLAGDESPALSAWNFRVLMPMFIRSSLYNFLGAGVSALQIEFRLVKIDSRNTNDIQTGASKVAGIRPTIGGVDLKLGDVFYFDDNNDPVLLSLDKTSLMSTLGGESNQAVESVQRWARKAAFLRSSDSMIRIFVVAGEIEFGTGAYDYALGFYNQFDPIVGQRGFLNNSEIYAIISRVLDIQFSIDESILGGVNNAWDGSTLSPGDTNNYETPQGVEVLRPDTTGFTSFSLDLPQDTDIRGQFQDFEDSINDTIDFKLCGLSLRGLTNDYPTGTFTDSDRRSQLDPNNPGFIKSSLHDALYLYDPDGAIVGVPGHDFQGDMADGMLHANNVTQIDSNWLGDYFKAIVDTTVETESSIFFETPVYGTGETDINGTHQTNAMYRISYQGLDTSAPRLNIVAETYNEAVGRRIDRFVQRRSTSNNTIQENGPLKPGPFGSLKKTINLKSRRLYLDSLAPKSISDISTGYCATFEHGTKTECEAAHAGQWVDTDYVTTLADLPTQFLLEGSEEKAKIRAKGIRVKMLLNPNGTGPSTDNTDTIDITNDSGYEGVGVFTWGNISFPQNIYDEGGLGLLGVTNYIQKDFRGLRDFSGKTVNDFFLGFGNGANGKHKIRPSIKEYFSYTTSTPGRFSTEWIMDPPRGSRFGLMNTHPVSPSYHFSYSHYGHLRDMFEQALDSKVSGAGSDPEVLGSPVVVNPINSANPEVPKLMENTSRYNKTTDATITIPYIESNYEATPNPPNLNAESLRVDVAGSIRTRAALAPGNVAANIRRRG